MAEKILLIEDEEELRNAYSCVLRDEGYEVLTAQDFDGAMSRLDEVNFDLVITDIMLGGRTGIDILHEIKAKGLSSPVVMITGVPTVETAAEAVRLGAFDYIPKPVHPETLVRVASMALRFKKLNYRYELSRKNLEAIFRSVKEAIITVDEYLNIIEMNIAAEELCGPKENAVGNPVESRLAHCCDELINVFRTTVQEKQSMDIGYVECTSVDKSRKIVHVSTYPLVADPNSISGAVMVLRDDTRLIDLERDLKERRKFHGIIGKSEKMQEIYFLIGELSGVESTVLITGESGTGKELVAEALHYAGERSTKPLIKVNCAALSEQLLESELFGHVKGAFTGAVRDKPGKFELADGGTLLLDEIGEITPAVQVKLLRVLQSKEFERVGGTTPIKVDVRVVAATNRDITDMVNRGKFREDLYYRLSVIEIHIPPLRDRLDDVPILTDYFLGSLSKKIHKELKSVTRDVLKMFMAYSWPGNIRELQHTMEHAAVLTRDPIISVDDLSSKFKKLFEMDSQKHTDTSSTERFLIIEALEKSGWKKAKAARLLSIGRTTLYQKIREYNISK